MLQAFLLVASFSCVVCMGLPPYISSCSRNDPNLNDCALKSARESLHQFSLGDSERNLHTLDPLLVEEMVVYIPNKQGFKVVFKDNIFRGLSALHMENLKMPIIKSLSNFIIGGFGLIDCSSFGLENVSGTFLCVGLTTNMRLSDFASEAIRLNKSEIFDFQRLRFDLDKKLIIADALVTLDVKNKYELSGKLLGIPIDSKGDSSISLKNTLLHIRYWYEHVEGPDGKIHWKIYKNDIKYEVEKASFKLENLLNDKNIGDQINRLLNEMWREIVADVGPSICHSLGTAVVENLSILLEQVSYDELMPE